ncbi:hypothetical protein H0H81_001676 [Sphagnurus paluster]|uniref:Uncharacterized protein n=1 Tax=Sphagnurus paluster TaxID=117069 RepID=A0A9P7FPE8_9AGAR|nr:hypothetical protein H0H81_001676 [Sphagnurus paluster]
MAPSKKSSSGQPAKATHPSQVTGSGNSGNTNTEEATVSRSNLKPDDPSPRSEQPQALLSPPTESKNNGPSSVACSGFASKTDFNFSKDSNPINWLLDRTVLRIGKFQLPMPGNNDKHSGSVATAVKEINAMCKLYDEETSFPQFCNPNIINGFEPINVLKAKLKKGYADALKVKKLKASMVLLLEGEEKILESRLNLLLQHSQAAFELNAASTTHFCAALEINYRAPWDNLISKFCVVSDDYLSSPNFLLVPCLLLCESILTNRFTVLRKERTVNLLRNEAIDTVSKALLAEPMDRDQILSQLLGKYQETADFKLWIYQKICEMKVEDYHTISELELLNVMGAAQRDKDTLDRLKINDLVEAIKVHESAAEPSKGTADAALVLPVALASAFPKHGVTTVKEIESAINMAGLVRYSSITGIRVSKGASTNNHNSEYHLRLPVLMVEYKKANRDFKQAVNQVCMYCVSSLHFMAALGHPDCTIFGVATWGTVGFVLMAWYDATVSVI